MNHEELKESSNLLNSYDERELDDIEKEGSKYEENTAEKYILAKKKEDIGNLGGKDKNYLHVGYTFR